MKERIPVSRNSIVENKRVNTSPLNMKTTRVIAGLLFVFFLSKPATVCAAEPSILTAVRGNYNGEKSIQASVSLHITWKIREKTEDKSGRIYFAPGEKYRVELGNDILVSDGKTQWHFSRSVSQVVISPAGAGSQSVDPAEIVRRYLTTYTYKKKSEDAKTITVEPVNMADQSVTSLRLTLDKETAVVTELFYVDGSGNDFTYSFRNTRIGQKIPEKVFTFEVPKGATVVDQRN